MTKREKTCIYCGKKFIPHANEDWCKGVHYKKCEVCNKEFSFVGGKKIRKTCSKECCAKLTAIRTSARFINMTQEQKALIFQKAKITNKLRGNKLGASNEKYKQTMIRKYGVSNAWQTESVKKKRNVGNSKKRIPKYGTLEELNAKGIKNIFQLEEVKAKIRKTNLERYGVESPAQNKEIQAKIMKTNFERYGQVAWNKKTFKKTMLEKYGVDAALKNDIFVKKFKNTRNKTTATKMNNKMAKFMSDDNYVKELFDKLGVCEITQWEEELDFSSQQIGRRLNNLNIEFKKTISREENKFANLLKKYQIGFEREYSGIDGYRYDFKVKDFLIEINPSATHNSTYGLFDLAPKDKNYHLNKTLAANKAGFKCIHIFDWDDKEKIINIFLNYKEKIYARNCKVAIVDKIIEKDFLNNNHLQGCAASKISYGLFYKEELVEIMTFGKPRFNKSYEWELIRLCSDKNIIVIGGASKLLKYFIKNKNPKNIISYQDVSKFNGNVYKEMGFNYIKNTGLNYRWCKGKQHLPRYRTQMKNETQEMVANGYVKVYDCGNNLWEYNL